MQVVPVFPAGFSKPKGHYSPAIVYNGVVYVSGQLPVSLDGTVQLGTIEEQTELCMQNIETILQAAGSSLQQIVKVSIFITDISLWPRVNEVYARIMGDHKPARIIVPCGPLHYGCSVEIDCVAARN